VQVILHRASRPCRVSAYAPARHQSSKGVAGT
jgi:hypothetical protein